MLLTKINPIFVCKSTAQWKNYSSQTSPEICFDPETWEFHILGKSAPEDVRSLYYPVIEWTTRLVNTLLLNPGLTGGQGIRLEVNLTYFNSSSGKFLHDIFTELARFRQKGGKIDVVWYYDSEDTDMYEAGVDMASLAEMEFTFMPK